MPKKHLGEAMNSDAKGSLYSLDNDYKYAQYPNQILESYQLRKQKMQVNPNYYFKNRAKTSDQQK